MRSFLVSRGLVSGLLLCSFALFGCDTSTLPDGVVTVVTGPGDDPWSGPPPVTRVQLDQVTDTDRTTLATVSAPPDTISLGHEGPSDVIVHLEMTGFGADGSALVFGASARFYAWTYSGYTVPIFMARKGGFANAPTALLNPHIHPLSTLLYDDYLFAVGSEDTAVDINDALTWSAPVTQVPLIQTVKSFAVTYVQAADSSDSQSHTLVLLINDTTATFQDFDTGALSDFTPPTPLAVADISGGQTLVASDGTIYIVGATRTDGAATDRVLRIDTDHTLHAVLLNTPRLGAAATLVEGALLVAGGSSKGAGAELLAQGSSSFRELALPADETSGASLVELTSTTALLAGGHDASGAASATRSIDLNCTSDCSATEVPQASLDVGRTSAFRLSDNVALIVGESDDTQTHAYLFDASGDAPTLSEQSLITPRSQASAARLPNGQISVFGGTALDSGNPALSMEVFVR